MDTDSGWRSDLKYAVDFWHELSKPDFWSGRFTWEIDPSMWGLFVLALLIYPACRYLPKECGYENGLLENIQMFLLGIGVVFGFFIRQKREMFLFAGMILFVMALRETNFGKTLFYPDPLHPNEFLSWKEIWYAPYVDPVMILYGLGVAVFFFVKKVWKQMFEALRGVRIPAWDCVALVLCALCGYIVDKKMDNELLEEAIELVFYAAIVATLWYYATHLPRRMEVR